MPVILLERLPLPSLKTYTAISVALLACSVYYAHQTLKEDDARSLAVFELLDYNINLTAVNGSVFEKAYLMAYVLSREPWCLVTVINMAYCCLILFGKLIQQIVFGQLRVAEQQHIKDKFWNFVFYKFIFIFGVMNVQEMDEVVLWCTWFSVLGFLHVLAQLCKDRFEYLSFSPATPLLTHAKVLLLLTGIHTACLGLLGACIAIGYFYSGINTFAFLAAETVLLIIKTLYVLVRYGIHLWDVYHDGVWENRAIYVYYSELVFEISALAVDFCHHLHMLLWGNIFLSMASLVICMQLRYLFHEFQRRFKRHQNYRRVVSSMEARFPMASSEELQRNCDDCAICWEKMETARKLPCGHIFHNACLRSWLEQDTSCPTCRNSLSDLHLNQDPAPVHDVIAPSHNEQTAEQHIGRRQRFTNRFHFDGSRYISWLPSFSVEVTHMLGGYTARRIQLQTSQFDNMARQVQDVFPSIPLSIIIEDLHVTNSVELTIDNIVEGRLTVTPDFSNGSTAETGPITGDVSAAAVSRVNGDDSDDDDNDEYFDDDNVGASLSSYEPAEVLSGRSSVALHDPAISMSNSGTQQPITEPTENDVSMPRGSGYRFSKSSTERESMLALRKESMIEEARRRYIARESHAPSSTAPSSSEANGSSVDMIQQRRELVYHAIQRRLNSPSAHHQ